MLIHKLINKEARFTLLQNSKLSENIYYGLETDLMESS